MRDKRIRSRDWNLVRLLQGATKSGVHLDWKKEKNRLACREWNDEDNDGSRFNLEGGGCDTVNGLQVSGSDPAVYPEDTDRS